MAGCLLWHQGAFDLQQLKQFLQVFWVALYGQLVWADHHMFSFQESEFTPLFAN